VQAILMLHGKLTCICRKIIDMSGVFSKPDTPKLPPAPPAIDPDDILKKSLLEDQKKNKNARRFGGSGVQGTLLSGPFNQLKTKTGG